MGVAIDEPGHEIRIRKMERLHAARGWDGAVWTDRGDAAVCINENGSVFDGRRRNRMDPASSDAEHEAVSGIGYSVLALRLPHTE